MTIELLSQILMEDALVMIGDIASTDQLGIGPEKRRLFDAAVLAARRSKSLREEQEERISNAGKAVRKACSDGLLRNDRKTKS